MLCDVLCLACSSSRVEDVTHAYTSQRPIWQASTYAADAECQLSSTLQQPCLISSAAGDGAAALSSGSKSAALPLFADATSSSASLAADAVLQSSGPQLQQRSTAKQSGDEQHSSSSHWAQEIIKVITRHPLVKHPCGRVIGADSAEAAAQAWDLSLQRLQEGCSTACRLSVLGGLLKFSWGLKMAMSMQVVKVPEARMLMLSLAATSSAQGVRGAFLAVKDVMLGEVDSSGQLQSGLLQQQQKLYVLVGVMFLTVLFFARLACDYVPDFQVHT